MLNIKGNKKNTESEKISLLTDSYDKNKAMLQNIFINDDTIVFKEIINKVKNDLRICIIFEKGMVDYNSIDQSIIHPILTASINRNNNSQAIDIISTDIITSTEISKTSDVDEIVGSILYGNTIILIENSCEALIMSTQGYKTRSIEEPLSEKNIRGPREGFTEVILINISLIRRKITSADLKFMFRTIGRRTKTRICIAYIESLANKKILKELEKRLEDINIDAILDSGYIQELIQDSPLSPFKTIGITEKPDRVAANLLEGRIAVVVDGSPTVLTLPFIFAEYFQTTEDYYNDFWYASFNRFIRYVSFFLSTSVTALYTAIISFHHEIIPTPLLLSISAAREGLPFPTVLEAILMVFMFEILREVGVRMPSPMGSTLGFVGAVVLGQAAVSARFISAPMVIIIGLTGISSYLLPNMIMPLNIVRFLLLMLSAFLGIFGFTLGLIGLFIHLMTIRSFGVPYMLYLGTLKAQDIKDTVLRLPWWYMNYNPRIIGRKNTVREKGRI